jgi:D-alanyl-D-alanine carboxypeptidase
VARRSIASDLNPSWGYAAGTITSTAADVATFYKALLRGSLISKRSLQAMRVAIPVSSTAAYGLGLQRTRTTCGWFWGHDGGTFGYTSNAFVSADGRRVAVVLANQGPLGDAQHSAFNRLAARAACETRS